MSTARECSICWYVYDPEAGDDVWQIAPGTAFEALPPEWRCPRCDAAQDRFFLRAEAQPVVDSRVAALVSAYERIQPRMQELPIFNPALRIEAVAFRPFEGGLFGALVTPWSVNAVLLPASDSTAPALGARRDLPGGTFDFLPQRLEGLGVIELVPLISPALELQRQEEAVEAARGAVEAMLAPPQEEPRGRSRRELFALFRRHP